MKPPPELPDPRFEELVAEAIRTQPARPGEEAGMFQRMKTVEEYLTAITLPDAVPALVFRDAADGLRALPLTRQVTAGRDPGCDIAFPEDRTLSSAHFRVTPQDGFFVLCDSGSRNGTRLNGQPVKTGEHVLRDGDLISAGRHVFVFSDVRPGSLTAGAEG